MEKEDYQKAREDVLKKYGKPEYLMGEPENESARILSKLKADFARSKKKINAPEEKIKKIAEESTSFDRKTGHRKLAVKIPVKAEPQLSKFSEEEQSIIYAKYSDLDQNSAQIAQKANVTRQKVVTFLNSPAFLAFEQFLVAIFKEDRDLYIEANSVDILKHGQDSSRTKVLDQFIEDKRKSAKSEDKGPKIEDKTLLALFKKHAEMIVREYDSGKAE